MKKAVIILMIITIFSKAIGFLRDVVLANYYGASGISDAYLVALTVPAVIFGVVSKGISTGYIPMYSRIEENRGKSDADYYTNNLINVLLLICTAVIALGLIFAGALVRVFASGFEGETFDAAVMLTRVSIVGIYFTIIIRILSAYLNYRKYFAVPSLLGIPMSLIVIASIVFSYQMDMVIVLAIGYVAALIVQFLILMYFAHKKNFAYRPVVNFKDDDLKTMLALAVPVILGSMVSQINKLVDRTLASQIATGGISALNYAHTLNNFVHGVFVTSIATVIYPSISKMASRDNIGGLKYVLYQSVIGISILMIPATVGAILLAEPIVELLFGRGAFDNRAVSLTSDAFLFYSIGMIGTGLRVVLSRTFYSLQDTKTPMINAAIAMGMNIVLNFILSYFMGISGLALATSISEIFCTALLFYHLRKKIGKLNAKRMVQAFAQIAAAAAIMGIVTKLVYNFYMPIAGANVAVIYTVVVSAFVYAVLIYFMKINGIHEVIEGAKDKLLLRKK